MSGLYQAVLLGHAKAPHGAGSVPRGTEDGEAINGACGDEIRVKLHWGPDGALERLVHEVRGCAVCAASASMAASRIEGRTRTEIETASAAFAARLGKKGFEEEWGDFRAFNGIERYPSRIHCAMLAWKALDQAVRKAPEGRRG